MQRWLVWPIWLVIGGFEQATMILGKVITNVVATEKHPALTGHALFWIQPITADGRSNGEGFIALDSVDAGPGDLVIVCNEGGGCRQVLNKELSPVNYVITGVVDRI